MRLARNQCPPASNRPKGQISSLRGERNRRGRQCRAGIFRDWYSNLGKFPHGIDGLSDYAHRAGLKFGLWVDWTQAGTDSAPGALNVHDPSTQDWLTRDVSADWKAEPFKGVTIDI